MKFRFIEGIFQAEHGVGMAYGVKFGQRLATNSLGR